MTDLHGRFPSRHPGCYLRPLCDAWTVRMSGVLDRPVAIPSPATAGQSQGRRAFVAEAGREGNQGHNLHLASSWVRRSVAEVKAGDGTELAFS